jgi:transcriptional regulator with XRE-family HTH domain
MQLSSQVGLIIFRLRKERGMTQQELGDKINLQRTQIGKLEKGQRSITVDTLLNLANALQVSVYALLPIEVKIKDISFLANENHQGR